MADHPDVRSCGPKLSSGCSGRWIVLIKLIRGSQLEINNGSDKEWHLNWPANSNNNRVVNQWDKCRGLISLIRAESRTQILDNAS